VSLPTSKTILDQVDQLVREVKALQSKLHATHDGRNAVDRMRDAMNGHPKAMATDHVGGRSGTLWCWDHGQELRRCHADEQPCKGESLVGPSDPTGTAAMLTDRAAEDLREIGRNLKTMRNVCDSATVRADNYPARPASNLERAKTARANDPQCESCARVDGHAKGVPMWSAPMLNGSRQPYRTTVGDKLKRPMYLCVQCHDHVAAKGCPPSKAELEQLRQGKGYKSWVSSGICKHQDHIEPPAEPAKVEGSSA
jgi:hypothetical protein